MEGVNAERALQEIKEYNAAVQNDKPFNMAIKDGRRTEGLKIDKTNWANTVDEPPFEAFAVTCGVTFSFGGLKITNDGEVEGHVGQADPRSLRGGRARRRHLLSQLSRRHGAHQRLGVRQDRRDDGRRLREGRKRLVLNERAIDMNAPAIKITKPVREQVSREEWETRVNLAACYRLMAEYGMVEMIANHISARVPGTRTSS